MSKRIILRSMFSLLVCAELGFFMTSSAVSQSLGMPAEKWWYNFPSSPLKFQPTNSDSSMLDLKRDSLPGEKILSYRLGCLAMNDGHVQITKRLQLKELNLESGHEHFSSASLFRSDIRGCTESKPLLAVIEVRFADGGVWAIATTPDNRAKLPSRGTHTVDPTTGNLRVTVPLVATTKPNH
jgi:hypothetical protein